MENRKLLAFISILLLLIVSLPPPLYSQGRVAGEIIMTRGLDTSTGDIFFVDDSGSNEGASNGSVTTPFATLDYAIGRTSASVGDTIFLMEGHAETLTAADAVDVDVAGIKIIGLGTGNLRATFTMASDAAAEINIDAANVYLANIIIVDNIACTACIELTANADGFHMDNVLIREGSQQPAIMIDMTGQADDVLIENSTFLVPTADTGATGIDLSALTPARFTFRNNVVRGDFNQAAIFGSGALTDANIHDNIFENALSGQFAAEFSAASLGVFHSNLMISSTAATVLDPGSLNTWKNSWSIGIDQDAVPFPAYSEYVEGLGYRVTKVNDISQDEDPLFDVTGSVLITLMFLEVTTGTGADTQVFLETDGNIAMSVITQLDSCSDGDLVLVQGDPLEFLGGQDNPCDGAYAGMNSVLADTQGNWSPFIVGGAGDSVVIQLDTATDTGVLFWTLFYLPLSTGATVTTAS